MEDTDACSVVDADAEFQEASARVKDIAGRLTEEQLLQFYGYYKQAVEGRCSKPKPSWFQAAEKRKWQAWSSLGDMGKREAMEKYVELLNSLDKDWRTSSPEKSPGWVHHSSMQNTDEEIKDNMKTVHDWVKEGNFDKVKSLLDAVPDIDELDESGLSLLHWGADRGALDIVRYLIKTLNADINIKDFEGQTPLHYASSCGHDEVLKFLLESGADTNIVDNDGLTPLDVASGAHIENILKTT